MSDNPAPPNTWLVQALRGIVMDIGQLKPADRAALAAGVRLRLLIRTREPAGRFTPARTVWRLHPTVKLCDD